LEQAAVGQMSMVLMEQLVLILFSLPLPHPAAVAAVTAQMDLREALVVAADMARPQAAQERRIKVMLVVVQHPVALQITQAQVVVVQVKSVATLLFLLVELVVMA
jgi:hypothetical protein